MKNTDWPYLIMVVVVVVIPCFLIIYVTIKDNRQLQDFSSKCSGKGGITHRIEGARGMSKPLCLKPGTLIDIKAE